MYNKVVLIGRLTRDPESKTTSSGIQLSRFTIAIDRFQRAGEKTTDFINVITWRRLAEVAEQYLKKGKLISVEGSLRIDNYEKNGQSREWVEVVADNFQMLDRVSEPEAVTN